MYRPLDWVMVRTPLLPIEAYLDPPDATAAGTALPADPRIQRALAVGAGDLFRALEKPPGTEKAKRRLDRSLRRYLIRMSTRPTPFGTFAGVAVAPWGDATDLALSADPARIRTRPDMGWLLDLIAELERRPEVHTGLRWYANPAACLRADRLFLTERAVLGDPAEATRAVNLRATPAVRAALECARMPIPYDDLIARLTANGAPREKVKRLVQQLWEQTVLLTDLRPPLTIADPARYVAERLASVPAARTEAAALAELLDEIADWDRMDVDQAAAGYPKLVAKARAVHDAPAAKGPFQTDMAVPLQGRITARVATEATRLAELLLRLSPSPHGSAYLDKYRQEFEVRYGRDREIPLLELLDAELGMGPPQRTEHRHTGEHPIRDRALVDLALNAIKDGRLAVELDDVTLDKLELAAPAPERAPVSLDLSVFVLAVSATALDAGDFRLVVGPNLGGGAAGRVLGRFADLVGDQPLREAAEAEAAASPTLLRAEVSYLSRQARLSNVAIRPLVREREIALGTTPGDRHIPADELVVGIRGDRFVIRWTADGRDVVPCAGHMLNTMGAPEVVRFLEEVYRDGRTINVGFDWGPAAGFPFLPRVQRGRLVLAPARWRLEPGNVAALDDWRERWHVPRYVYLATGDNRLLLDLDDPDHVAQLRDQVREPVVLHEALPAPGDAWLPGPDGRYLSELVVPMVHAGPGPEPARRTAPIRRTATAQRLRPPGSDWLFAKLYHVPAYEHDLIAGPVCAFGAQALAEGTADSWFFMRYTDPDPHLRVRWHGDAAVLTERLAPRLLSWGADLVAAGYCKSFGLDTYDQEIERYGGPDGMDLAERLFHADSEAVAELLHLMRSRELDLDPSLLGVYTVDKLLASLGFDAAEREALCRTGIRDRKETSKEFREQQFTLRSALGDPSWLPSPAAPVLSAWSARIAEIAQELDAVDLATSRTDLARSYVHMHCNRLLGCGHPPEQRVLGLLVRTRESLARAAWQPR